jgi:hypothetical protein
MSERKPAIRSSVVSKVVAIENLDLGEEERDLAGIPLRARDVLVGAI